MNKLELIKKISELTSNDDLNSIKCFIDAFFEAIRLGLNQDRQVTIGKWGKFYLQKQDIEYKEKDTLMTKGSKTSNETQRKKTTPIPPPSFKILRRFPGRF